MKLPWNIGVLINTIVLNMLICTPVAYMVTLMLFSGEPISMAIAISVTISLHIMMKKFIDLTKITKDSNEGMKKQE